MVYEEDDYLQGLVAYSDLPKKEWLLQYFGLYKSTLIWPPGYPPINTCNLIKGTLREKFNSTYKAVLLEFDYEFDNEQRTLTLNWRYDDFLE
jgi:hypothetical protein